MFSSHGISHLTGILCGCYLNLAVLLSVSVSIFLLPLQVRRAWRDIN